MWRALGLAVQRGTHAASRQMYNDSTLRLQLWVWHRKEGEKAEKESQRGRGNLYRVALIAALILTLNAGYFTSTPFNLHSICSIISCQPCAHSLLHHPTQRITTFIFPLSLHPSILPLHLLRSPPNPYIYVSAVALQKQQNRVESH